MAGGFSFVGLADGWEVGRFGGLASLGFVAHAVTTRRGPDVHRVAGAPGAAAGEIAEALGLEGAAFCRQVHGTRVLATGSPGGAGEADGLVTATPGLGLMGRSADCPLLLVADPVTRAVGLAHASWRGTVGRIAAGLVSSLNEHFGTRPADLVACIAPSAGPCCYEVGSEVRDAAVAGIGPDADMFFAQRDGRLYLDLWAANAGELAHAGVAPANIHVAGVCTICRNDLLPSFRAEGDRAGRFAAVIGCL